MFNCLKPFTFHTWGQWQLFCDGEVTSRISGGIVARTAIQERKCEKCGYVQRKPLNTELL